MKKSKGQEDKHLKQECKYLASELQMTPPRIHGGLRVPQAASQADPGSVFFMSLSGLKGKPRIVLPNKHRGIPIGLYLLHLPKPY